MSVERVVRKDGSAVWRVRWRQAGRNRSKVLGRKRDAEAFDAEIVRRKRSGELARLDAGKEPLAEFGEEWWRLHAEPNLARSTLKGYASIWDTHVLPRLGSVPLRELTPDVVNRFRLELEADGVGPASIRKSLVLLQGVLQRACEWGRLGSNPAAIVRKPVPPRKRTIVPLAPERVEAIRFVLLACGRIRDGFADGELVIERERLCPDDQVLRDQRELKPDGVVVKVAERQILQAGLLAVANAVLGAGASAVQALEPGRVAGKIGQRGQEAVAVMVGEGQLRAGVRALAAHDHPAARGPAGQIQAIGDLGHPRALALGAVLADRRTPCVLGQAERTVSRIVSVRSNPVRKLMLAARSSSVNACVAAALSVRTTIGVVSTTSRG